VPHTPTQNRNNALSRWRSADDPERQAADRAAREERLSCHIRGLVDGLTVEQRSRLAELIVGSAA
jgi:hypothetical protein